MIQGQLVTRCYQIYGRRRSLPEAASHAATEEFATIERAAGPIHPAERALFLQAMAEELAQHEVRGAGLVHRLCAHLQKQFVVQARRDAESHRGEAHRGPRKMSQGGRQAATEPGAGAEAGRAEGGRPGALCEGRPGAALRPRRAANGPGTQLAPDWHRTRRDRRVLAGSRLLNLPAKILTDQVLSGREGKGRDSPERFSRPLP